MTPYRWLLRALQHYVCWHIGRCACAKCRGIEANHAGTIRRFTLRAKELNTQLETQRDTNAKLLDLIEGRTPK